MKLFALPFYLPTRDPRVHILYQDQQNDYSMVEAYYIKGKWLLEEDNPYSCLIEREGFLPIAWAYRDFKKQDGYP